MKARLALARSYQRIVDEERIKRADLARRFGVSRAAITKLLSLLDLAPAIQSQVEALVGAPDEPWVTERDLLTIARLETQDAQCTAFEELIVGRRAPGSTAGTAGTDEAGRPAPDRAWERTAVPGAS